MATPGWYPDPSGLPDTLRYWDGTTWTAHLASRPTQPAQPAQPVQAPGHLPASTTSSMSAPSVGASSMGGTTVLAYLMLAVAATFALGLISFLVVRSLI